MLALRELMPNWPDCRIHESSPGDRGTSVVLARDCRGYIATQFFPEVRRGEHKDGIRCEDLEQQTFGDDTFDLVITQDVMEHIFHPDRAYREVWRTLKPGGLYIHTTPIYKDLVASERRASLAADGTVSYHFEPEYHGNPVNPTGSLVTFHYGYDLADLIAAWTLFDVEIRRHNQRSVGIVAEFSEVIICRKTDS
jgi:SAM-dependent methyltransferase